MRLRTFVFMLVASLARAQQAATEAPPGPSMEGRTVSRVEFLPADQPLPREELDRLLPVHTGAPLRMSEIREAIQKLYLTGRFSDISVDATIEGEGTVIAFTTAPTYFVSRVSIQGEDDPPNRNQLSAATQLDLGSPFQEDAVEAAKQRILERLRANGLYDATLQHHIDLIDDTEEASIYIDVNPGKRARFGGVEISAPASQPLSPIARSGLIRATEWHRGLRFLTLPGWRSLTENRVQVGLENLRRRLQRDDRLQARVTLDSLERDAAKNIVIPHLTIDNGPIIEVRATGYDVGKTQLRELVPIFQERAVDPALVLEGQRNLTEHMQSKGYFDAEVRYVESAPSLNRSVIEYQIESGSRHKLRSIVIAGNMYFDAATLRERMYIQPASFLRFRSGRYSPRLLAQDVEAVRGLYQTNGFRDAKVVPEVVESPLEHTDISIHLQITEGLQWFVNKLAISGLNPEDEAYLRAILRSTEGQPFSPTNVAADRDTILTYFYNDGYPGATFTWTQAPGPADGLVDVGFTIQPGERQYVRGVLVRGLESTDPTLVSSRILLRAGDPLSQSQIAASQQKLYDLGIFAKVQTATQNPDGKEESKYVIFYADEARKYSLNFGVGAEAARIVGFAPRVSVGLSRINFMGLGHTISLQTLTSTRQRRALLNYIAPQFKGNPNLALTFSALFNDARDVKTFAARRWEASIQLSQRFSRSLTGQMRFTFRRVTLDPNSLKISPDLISFLNRPVRVGLVGSTIFRDRRDDPVDSHRGTYNSLDVATALAAFGSQTSFTRLLVRNSTYHPIRKDIVIARSVQFGYIGRMGGLPDIPLAERFFAGGASSQRAFPDNQAGPRDLVTGFPLGGTALLFHSTELRFPLIGDNLGGVIFHDMGNVYSAVENVSFRVRQKSLQDFDYMAHSVGTGVRYRTPIGPIRVDLAYGTNSPKFFGFAGSRDELLNSNPSIPLCSEPSPLCRVQRINQLQFHFSLGQTF
ncbi:MAG: outer membrane protein assembly factor BamA [Bryobacteraceae bacterium]